jgi:hypothetical protein
MRLISALPVVAIAMAPLAGAAHAAPGERDRLNACQEMVERAARPEPANGRPGAAPDDRELARCRQIIREWTLRDSRMSVDEQGRPLR